MRILFLHGLGVKTGGIKPSFLRSCALEVTEPILPHGDFDECVRLAQQAIDSVRPHVVVGDCRGGAAALATDSGDRPLLLIAPAWKKWGRTQATKKNSLILHSHGDTVIPLKDSLELARRSRLPPSALRIVGKDHFMEDPQALDALLNAIHELSSGRSDGNSTPGIHRLNRPRASRRTLVWHSPTPRA